MRLFLASNTTGETMNSLEVVQPKNILMSYYYLKLLPVTTMETFFERMFTGKSKFFLDSGVFTFMEAARNSKKRNIFQGKNKMQFLKNFNKEYIIFIQKYWKYIYCYAEMDADLIVGYKRVLELRGMFPSNIKSKLLPVYHPETRTLDDWKRECKEYEYIALGSVGMSANPLSYYASKMSFAYKNGNRVHGFALVNQKVLKTFPFYSVDSSSWMASSIYGRLTVWNSKENKLKSFGYRDKKEILKYFAKIISKKQFANLYEENRKTAGLSRRDRLQFNIYAFIELEKYLTKLWEKRGVKFIN